MRPVVFLAAVLCLLASPTVAVEGERILQSSAPSTIADGTADTTVPSISPAPSVSPAPSMADTMADSEGEPTLEEGSTLSPTEEPTSGSFKAGTVCAMAGAATLLAVGAYF